MWKAITALCSIVLWRLLYSDSVKTILYFQLLTDYCQTQSYPGLQLKNGHYKKKKKMVTPYIIHIMLYESLVSLMILYVRNTSICQIVKYTC